MPLLGAIKSREERYEEAQQNPLLLALEQATLDKEPFFKKLSNSTRMQERRLAQRWIVEGIALPPRQAFIGFASYLAINTQGRLSSQYAAKKTIKSYMNGIFGLFRRNALLKVPNDYHQQCFAFLDSADLERDPMSAQRREDLSAEELLRLFNERLQPGPWNDSKDEPPPGYHERQTT
ncbi:uncharacterized protein EV420DRAFT_1640182 [Desarmillaria tabescens]|uniref:Uncharacterized protein n=1 Tax=Armillaria tabescens TaxID=1929756 RepID=A0AA39NA63_ARMTA|nr:uncharacterized protein EV420DRAFT_1640182 [Desarmillaria tabescens]KAK0461881.1 hypothetical protein EV420DRAFT_1640182 [Desarmillaria tabescens]